MSEYSAIQWTDHTFNPWIGCTHVSPGCENCYAEVNTFTRAQRAHGRELWGATAARHVVADSKWRDVLRWNAAARERGIPAKVFCASMADVFEDRRDLDEPRARLWTLIEATPWLRWQLLTKRPENADKLTPGPWVLNGWPKHVWFGVTAEDQRRADERIPVLLRTRAAVHFVSYEPALGPVVFKAFLPSPDGFCVDPPGGHDVRHLEDGGLALDWVIVGGESGPGARPLDLTWARYAVAQCEEAGVPVFVKQLGAHCRMNRTDAVQPVAIGGAGWDAEAPGAEHGLVHFRGKGGDPIEWPADLRVREFPKEAA